MRTFQKVVILTSKHKQRSRCAKRTCFFVSLFLVRLKPTRHQDCATCCAEQGLRSKLAASLAMQCRMVRCPAGGARKKTVTKVTVFFQRCVPQAERDVSSGSEVRFTREVCLRHEIRNTSLHCDRREQHHYAKHDISLAQPKLH